MKHTTTISKMLYLAFFYQLCGANSAIMAVHDFFDFPSLFNHQTDDLVVRDMRDEKTPQVILTLRKDDCVLAIDFKNKAITNKDITIKPTTEAIHIAANSSDYAVSVLLKNVQTQSYITYTIEKVKKEKNKDAMQEMHLANNGSRSLDQIFDFEKTGDAQLQNGVLSLTLPYKKAKEITINIK